jgi:hypothetical protein
MSFRARCPASKVFFLLAGLRTLMPLLRNSQLVPAVSKSGVQQMIKKVAKNLLSQKIEKERQPSYTKHQKQHHPQPPP